MSSDPKGTLFDGDHTVPFLCKTPLPWVDEETRADMTMLTYRVRRPFYKKLPRSSTNGRAPGFLVEQPRPRIVGGDLLEYDLIFATVPDRPDEPLDYVMNYQFTQSGGSSGGIELVEIAVPLTATASWRYFQAASPKSIRVNKAWKAVQAGSGITFVGTPPKPGAKTWLAEDESINRWKPGGDIWEVRSVTVPALDALKQTDL